MLANRTLLFQGGTVYTGRTVLDEGWVLVRGGRIAALGSGRPPADAAVTARAFDLDGRALLPGLIDLHAHGALGCDTMDADRDCLHTMAAFYAQHGATRFLAATMSAEAPAIQAALRAVAEVRAEGTGGAILEGVHLEGPYLDRDHAGAQAACALRGAQASEYLPLLDTGVVRIVTLAPEIPENRALIAEARGRGIIVSMGHTGANYERACEAVELGVTHVTHVYNAMPPLHHSEPGAVAAALLQGALTCEIIADLVHVHPAMLSLAWRLKGPDRLALVTDAMAGTGVPDGTYALGGRPVRVEGGIARGANGALAGSTLTMERALANMAAAIREPLQAILPAATRVPARALGLQAGEIAVGLAGDLVVLSASGEVDLTAVSGQIVWER